MILRIGAGVGAWALAGLGLVVGEVIGGWLHLAAWLLPGMVGLAQARRGDLGEGWRRVEGLIAGWMPALVVSAVGVAVAGLGLAALDPAGEGLRAWWAATEAGRAALDVSDLGTLALGQAGLVLGAPVYALPLGLSGAVWVHGQRPVARALGLGLLVGGLAALGALPAGPGEGVAASLVAGLAWGGLAGAAGRWGPWATAGVLAGLHGLAGLGPLIGVGPPMWLGWTSVPVVGTAALLLGVLLRASRR